MGSSGYIQTPRPSKDGYGYTKKPTKKPKKPTKGYGYINPTPKPVSGYIQTPKPTSDPTDLPTTLEPTNDGYGYMPYYAQKEENHELNGMDEFKIVSNEFWKIFESHSLLIYGAIIFIFLLNVMCCAYIKCARSQKKKMYGFVSNKMDESDSEDAESEIELIEEIVQ